jgi:YHS domain-containing protein
MNRLLQILLSVAALVLTGCASRPEAAGTSSSAEYATCHVCEYNNDLACVRFRKKGTTPTFTYQGQTYSFCSKDCQSACAKNPGKYLHADR